MKRIAFWVLVLSNSICFSQNPRGSTVLVRDSIRDATDTVSITLADAETELVKNNYAMLAARYNVDAKTALIRQARLFNNPNIYAETPVYNKNKTVGRKWFPWDQGKYGDPSSVGDFTIMLNWTISIASKRLKTVNVVRLNADVAKYNFDDLMRGMLFALRQDFIDLYFGLKSLRLLDEEIVAVKRIVVGFELQFQKGNISLRDITRVRALLLSLQSDRMDLYTSLQQNSAKEFAVLLNDPRNVYYKPVLNEAELENKYNLSTIALADLVDQALQNRPDLKADVTQLESDEANVKLQKAIGVPDVMLQPGFVRNSNYIANDPVFGIGIPLPVANRNQGNIQSSKLSVISDEQQVKLRQVVVQNDVFTTYQKILELQKLNLSFGPNFSSDFRALLKGAEENFTKKNLSLLEFVDMFESYQASMSQYYRIKNQRYSAFEELNFHVGIDVFKR